jgi:hypothetical protein
MRLGRAALAQLLMTNVVELRFKRRIEKAGFGDYRRMLCTNDRLLLTSQLGRNILNFERVIRDQFFNNTVNTVHLNSTYRC